NQIQSGENKSRINDEKIHDQYFSTTCCSYGTRKLWTIFFYQHAVPTGRKQNHDQSVFTNLLFLRNKKNTDNIFQPTYCSYGTKKLWTNGFYQHRVPMGQKLPHYFSQPNDA